MCTGIKDGDFMKLPWKHPPKTHSLKMNIHVHTAFSVPKYGQQVIGLTQK